MLTDEQVREYVKRIENLREILGEVVMDSIDCFEDYAEYEEFCDVINEEVNNLLRKRDKYKKYTTY